MEENKSSTKMNEDYDYKVKDMEKNYNEVLKKKSEGKNYIQGRCKILSTMEGNKSFTKMSKDYDNKVKDMEKN